MFHDKKIRAFTLVEMIFTMLLTGILISLIYIIFSVVSKNFQDYGDKSHNMKHLLQLTTLMNHDIEMAQQVREELDGGFICIKGDDKLLYQFWHDKITRVKDLSTDTFHVVLLDYDFSFFGKDELVQEINLVFKLENREQVPVKIYKNYSNYIKYTASIKDGYKN